MALYHTQDINEYSARLIRTASNLSLSKKIILFKKFQKIIDGGCLFIEKKANDMSFQKFLKTLLQSEIGTISLRDCAF